MAAGAAPPPAGGAAAGEVIGATAAAALLTTALLGLGLAHRYGRRSPLARAAQAAARLPVSRGLADWAVLPLLVSAVSLVIAAIGMYWDISLHIDNGRDPGPLANPAHYFILAGLFGLFSAGWLALVLPRERPSRAAIRLSPTWQLPVSGVALMACGSFALLGFPLDDIWHRLFGQDVTLWGPTHLMLIGGAGLALIGVLALIVEGREQASATAAREPARNRREVVVFACGGLLIGLSVFQGEFDFGIEQFRLLFQPVLIAFAAATGLVVARIVGGRWAALGAAAFFIVLRGGLALLVGTALGESTPHFPLYLAEAAVVEAVAFGVSPARRPYRFAVFAGALIGNVGVLAEWAWSQAWMPVPWPGHMLGQAILFALPTAIAAGVLGAFAGAALRLRPAAVVSLGARAGATASLLVLGVVVGLLLPTTVPPRGAHAAVTLTAVPRAAGPRQAQATVRFDPPTLAADADWLAALSWQGHARLVLEPLRRGPDGAYRTSAPLPVSGSWKTMIRLQRGGTMASIPVYFPADRAIPIRGVAAPARFERGFTADRTLLQRERKRDVPTWLWATASLVVLGAFLLLLAVIGWALSRLAGSEPGSEGSAVPARGPRARPALRRARRAMSV